MSQRARLSGALGNGRPGGPAQVRHTGHGDVDRGPATRVRPRRDTPADAAVSGSRRWRHS
ncbi:hypothetical protein CURTO8I2_280084 [Curtobacterium sp. 8I-2]|nr:hypothetical protein CURTO8I2_280084 [Curtobacterium sp. 8I-2]